METIEKVNKSSQECAKYNAEYKTDIEHGIILAQQPTEEVLKREQRVEEAKKKDLAERSRITSFILDAISKSRYAVDWAKAELSLCEWREKDYQSHNFLLAGVYIRIEKFTSFSPGRFGHVNDRYYRLEISGNPIPMSRYDRYRRSERAAHIKLNERTTTEKLVEWFHSKVAHKLSYINRENQIAQLKQTAEQKKEQLLKENAPAFEVLKVNDISWPIEGKIEARVNFNLTPTQWAKLAEFTKTLQEV